MKTDAKEKQSKNNNRRNNRHNKHNKWKVQVKAEEEEVVEVGVGVEGKADRSDGVSLGVSEKNGGTRKPGTSFSTRCKHNIHNTTNDTTPSNSPIARRVSGDKKMRCESERTRRI